MDFQVPDSVVDLVGVNLLELHNRALGELHAIYEARHGRSATIEEIKEEFPHLWLSASMCAAFAMERFGAGANA